MYIDNKVEINREFSEAVMKQDIKKLEEIFSRTDKTKIPNIEQELVTSPAIMYAAMKKNWDMFLFFYDLGANLDVKIINNDWHLIHQLTKEAPDKIFNGILEYVEVDAQDDMGRTPLMIAIKEKKIDRALAILEKNPNLNLIDKKKNSLGHYASQYEAVEVLKKLVEENFDFGRKNKEGKAVLELLENDLIKESIMNYNPKISKIEQPKKLDEKILKEENKQEDVSSKKTTSLSKVKKKF